ncbi:MAG TPA: hypothetical protein V6C81_24740 [Planktothrix sp.]|jgi:hypothetical protein
MIPGSVFEYTVCEPRVKRNQHSNEDEESCNADQTRREALTNAESYEKQTEQRHEAIEPGEPHPNFRLLVPPSVQNSKPQSKWDAQQTACKILRNVVKYDTRAKEHGAKNE